MSDKPRDPNKPAAPPAANPPADAALFSGDPPAAGKPGRKPRAKRQVILQQWTDKAESFVDMPDVPDGVADAVAMKAHVKSLGQNADGEYRIVEVVGEFTAKSDIAVSINEV